MWRAALGILMVASACGGRTAMAIDEPGDAGARDAGARDVGELDAPTDAPAAIVCDREVRIRVMPTARVQLAAWIEAEGRFATIALTEATARRGIGNRPGALQMNSGFHWPAGRRENVLPGWAGARLRSGASPFPRVVYRMPGEGLAHRPDVVEPYRDAEDPYFCLSFTAADTGRDRLDAVSCASGLTYDRGRYLSEADTAMGYAEPFETAPGVGAMRPLSVTSAYPPRRDLERGPFDHPDVARYRADAVASMPELDAVTLATPRADALLELAFALPAEWPDAAATVSVEVHTEGDYGGPYTPDAYPTPRAPDGAWDYWSQAFGYPYRGQPSVLFDVEVDIPAHEPTETRSYRLAAPSRRGTLDASLEVLPIDDTILDDPMAAPGSGADRLRRMPGGERMHVEILTMCDTR